MLNTVFRWCIRLAILAIILLVFVSVIFTLGILVVGIVRLINSSFIEWLSINVGLVTALVLIDVFGTIFVTWLWALDFLEDELG
jgi:hypothetical protein